MEQIEQLGKKFERKTVVIVSFNNDRIDMNGPAPGRFYQVTIDPTKLSPDLKFIRFGNNPGDELVGWQKVEWMKVESILGEWENDETPVLLYGNTDGVRLLTDA